MPSSYPVPWCAAPVSAGMMIAVPLELAASPLKSGRDLGGGDWSALVIGGTEKIRTGGAVVFCKVVAVTEAQVKRDGQVRAKGSPVHHEPHAGGRWRNGWNRRPGRASPAGSRGGRRWAPGS